MIEFYAGTGPDTQAVGIALEELFFDYRLMPGRAPLPAIAMGGARLVGASNILLALARKANRFLISNEDAKVWLAMAPPDMDALEARLGTADYILGGFSIVDMAVYPRIAADNPASSARPSVSRWMKRMAARSATGRGMGAVAA